MSRMQHPAWSLQCVRNGKIPCVTTKASNTGAKNTVITPENWKSSTDVPAMGGGEKLRATVVPAAIAAAIDDEVRGERKGNHRY